MATIGTGGRFHRRAAFTLALLFTFALAAPALAESGKSAAAAACQDGGYVDWTDAAGNAFRTTGACVSYVAHGGTLVPVVVDPGESIPPCRTARQGPPGSRPRSQDPDWNRIAPSTSS